MRRRAVPGRHRDGIGTNNVDPVKFRNGVATLSANRGRREQGTNARQQKHREQDQKAHDGLPDVRLGQQQRRRHAEQRQRRHRGDQRRVFLSLRRRPREQRRRQHHQSGFQHLDRLQGQKSEIDPAPRALHFGSQKQHRDHEGDGQHEKDRRSAPHARLDEYRWLLEELRVGLFAQELRTAQPVSAKRLDKVWAQIEA